MATLLYDGVSQFEFVGHDAARRVAMLKTMNSNAVTG
jgi:hypothetical protein